MLLLALTGGGDKTGGLPDSADLSFFLWASGVKRKKRENRIVSIGCGSLSYDFIRTLMVRGDHLGTSFDEVGCLG